MSDTDTSGGPSLRDQLREHRLSRHWTLQQLCDEIQRVTNIRLSYQTVSRYIEGEVGTREMSTYAIEQYLKHVQQRESSVPNSAA